MIVVDASAIVKQEPSHARIVDAMASNRAVAGAPSMVEVKLVLSSVLPEAAVDRVVDSFGLTPVDFTPAMAEAAIAAFRTYGKGRGHPAQLNFGDCLSYGVAKVLDAPLLYAGSDFARTDIRSALT